KPQECLFYCLCALYCCIAYIMHSNFSSSSQPRFQILNPPHSYSTPDHATDQPRFQILNPPYSYPASDQTMDQAQYFLNPHDHYTSPSGYTQSSECLDHPRYPSNHTFDEPSDHGTQAVPRFKILNDMPQGVLPQDHAPSSSPTLGDRIRELQSIY